MDAFARLVIRHRVLVLVLWVVLTAAGGYAAPKATAALTFEFNLPGQRGFQANADLLKRFGNGGPNPPVVMVVGDGHDTVTSAEAGKLDQAVLDAIPGARVVTYAQAPDLLSADRRTGAVLVYPPPLPGEMPYGQALPALEQVAHAAAVPVVVTGADALREEAGGQQANAGVLAETLFGAVGALLVLIAVFGSALALMPMLIAGASILTTFGIVWGLTRFTDVSFIVQFLLALIGLGVAIDYALLIVTRWREERGRGLSSTQAIERTMSTAGRSVLFSGATVAISLAALIALPVPFLRSVGFTGLLIPLVSVVAALTLLPALLLIAGERLEWPGRRSLSPVSRLWQRVGRLVVTHRWISAIGATAVLLALASPLLGIRLGQPSVDSLASAGGPASTGIHRLNDASLGLGVAHPIEVVTHDVAAIRSAVEGVEGVAGVAAPGGWTRADLHVVDVWTQADTSSAAGSRAAADIRAAAERTGAVVGGQPAEDNDFVAAVYGNAPWVVVIIVAITFLLLAYALRSIWLPVKALLLNGISLSAAYGITVLIWQHGVGTEALFDQSGSGAITIWVPIAVFAFLFGLSMDYEVFLLSRIREEFDASGDTLEATVRGVSRTGRLVSSAALILFLAFISLSRVPETDVKILATALALGILLDATIVRGVLAPALVALLGKANWWLPGRPGTAPANLAAEAAIRQEWVDDRGASR